ncbi:hypothetical protein NDU88_001732 [Pleurodeles waltl]|uniref:Uncharacterized protein n=1 Tax=Pleurodeles waltl TaxID=8319 RepID=A0AAV7Q6Y6_PLEWA|nr:hypothetical protein NDU88_001732 [Pleurodeles waltl]
MGLIMCMQPALVHTAGAHIDLISLNALGSMGVVGKRSLTDRKPRTLAARTRPVTARVRGSFRPQETTADL